MHIGTVYYVAFYSNLYNFLLLFACWENAQISNISPLQHFPFRENEIGG